MKRLSGTIADPPARPPGDLNPIPPVGGAVRLAQKVPSR